MSRDRYDEYYGKVIRAKSKREARQIANMTVGDEGRIWENCLKVACEAIDPDGPSDTLLTDFNAG